MKAKTILFNMIVAVGFVAVGCLPTEARISFNRDSANDLDLN